MCFIQLTSSDVTFTFCESFVSLFDGLHYFNSITSDRNTFFCFFFFTMYLVEIAHLCVIYRKCRCIAIWRLLTPRNLDENHVNIAAANSIDRDIWWKLPDTKNSTKEDSFIRFISKFKDSSSKTLIFFLILFIQKLYFITLFSKNLKKTRQN